MSSQEAPSTEARDLADPVDLTLQSVRCSHSKTRSEKSYSGNFQVQRTVCESCGRVIKEDNVLLGLERYRCPVDAKLDRCYLSCPVEDGSVGVFEQPCEPVRRLMEESGLVPAPVKAEP